MTSHRVGIMYWECVIDALCWCLRCLFVLYQEILGMENRSLAQLIITTPSAWFLFCDPFFVTGFVFIFASMSHVVLSPFTPSSTLLIPLNALELVNGGFDTLQLSQIHVQTPASPPVHRAQV